MNLSQLEAFCTVVKEGSISRAARTLHLTQPALSAQMHSLEEYFGIVLFNRNHKGVELTEAGESLFHYAKRMFQLKTSLILELEQIRVKSNRPIVIGAGSTIGGYALPCSIYVFKEKFSNAIINVSVMNSSEVLRSLNDREINLGFIEGFTQIENHNYTHLVDDELVLVAAPENPWGLTDSLTLKELKNIPLILREEGSGIRHSIQVTFQSMGYNINEFKIAMELNDLSAIKSSVEAQRGLTFIPRLAVKKELRTKSLIQIKIIDTRFLHPYGLVKRSGQFGNNNFLEKNFIQLITSPNERGFC